MRVLVSGSSGLVGSAICDALAARGHEVVRLVRSRAAAAKRGAVYWDPAQGEIDAAALGPARADDNAEAAMVAALPDPKSSRTSDIQPIDAVIHLAGEGIGDGYWTKARMARIRDSRVAGTRLLARTLAALEKPPAIFICASAMGYYGDGGDTILDETSPPGAGFLAEVAQQWEAACASMHTVGARVVHARMGHVLGSGGGLLGKLKPVFKLGLGGPLGDGRQWMSWMALTDIVRAYLFCLDREDIAGPVNFCTANPARNRDFMRALGRAWRRPAILPAPAWALRLVTGPMADEALLAGQRMAPRRLLGAGFEFEYETLDATLAALLR